MPAKIKIEYDEVGRKDEDVKCESSELEFRDVARIASPKDNCAIATCRIDAGSVVEWKRDAADGVRF